MQHRWLFLVLVISMAFDLLLIGMHVFVSQLPAQASLGSFHLLRVDIDGSVSELFEHLKLSLAVVCLTGAAWITSNGRFLAASACVATLLADNMFMIHERVGADQEDRDLTQFVFLALVGSIVLAVGTAACWTEKLAERKKLIAVFVALALVGFFAVGVDALHSSIAKIYPTANEPLALLEDGGELVSMSVLLAVCVEILIATHKRRFPQGLAAGALRKAGVEGYKVTNALGQVEEYRLRVRTRSVGRIEGTLVTSYICERLVSFFVLDPEDHIQSYHSRGEFYEAAELDLIRCKFRGGTFVDVGANVGNHSLYAAMFAGASRVLAFEPGDRASTILRCNVALNDLGHVIEHHKVGLSDRNGRGTLELKSDHNLGAAHLLQAPTGDLLVQSGDAILGSHDVAFIKIDTEGMECAVLRGLQRTIYRCKPTIFAEIEDRNFGECKRLLEDYGYTFSKVSAPDGGKANYLAQPR